MEIVTSPRVSPHDEYFIAHTGSEVVHYAFNPQGANIDTGQPVLEVTTSKEEWIERLAELGYNYNETSEE